MGSFRTVTQVPGNRFAESVAAADAIAAPSPAAVPRLPDRTLELLVDLQTFSEQDKAACGQLIAQRHALNTKTLEFVERMLAARYEHLQEEHESIKAAIRAQGAVLENLAAKIVSDSQEFLKLDNVRRVAQARAQESADTRKKLSRFASRAEIDEADRAADAANEKARAAENKAAEAGQLLNSLKIITHRNEVLKLDSLVEREVEVSAVLAGKDPILARYGFQQ